MKAYEYKHIYTNVMYEMLQNGDINLSEVLFRIEAVDEFCREIGWMEEIDVFDELEKKNLLTDR